MIARIYHPPPAHCRVCGRSISLRAANDHVDRERAIFNHEGACRNRKEAAHRDALAAIAAEAREKPIGEGRPGRMSNLTLHVWGKETDMATPSPIPPKPAAKTAPARLLCLSCSTMSAKPIPYGQSCVAAGHAAVRSEVWEGKQEKGIRHDYGMGSRT